MATHFVDAEAVAGHAGRVTDVEELREPGLFGKHDVPQVERSIVVLRDEADGGRRPVLLRSLLSVPLRLSLSVRPVCISPFPEMTDGAVGVTSFHFSAFRLHSLRVNIDAFLDFLP